MTSGPKLQQLSAAVFLDRDGTIIEERGYLNHPDLLQLIKGAAEAIAFLNQYNFKTIVVSNQSGVARGYFPEELLPRLDEKMAALLAEKNARLDAIYYCPHHPGIGPPEYKKDCECRKPKTGMIRKAASELLLDVSASYLVGDKASDIATALNAGCKSVLVLTGYGKGEWEFNRDKFRSRPDYVASDLLDAAHWIVNDRRSRHKPLSSVPA